MPAMGIGDTLIAGPAAGLRALKGDGVMSTTAPARKPDAAATPRRPYRRKGITLMPPKLVPLDPAHEQQAISALTELLRQLLESDRRQQQGQAPQAEHGDGQVDDRQP